MQKSFNMQNIVLVKLTLTRDQTDQTLRFSSFSCQLHARLLICDHLHRRHSAIFTRDQISLQAFHINRPSSLINNVKLQVDVVGAAMHTMHYPRLLSSILSASWEQQNVVAGGNAHKTVTCIHKPQYAWVEFTQAYWTFTFCK